MDPDIASARRASRRPSSNAFGNTVAAVLAVLLFSTIVLWASGCDPKSAWTSIGTNWLSPNSQVTCFSYDTKRDILYAGTEGQGLWRCTAASTSPHWSETGGRNLAVVGALALDSARNILYVSGGQKDTAMSGMTGGVWRVGKPDTSATLIDMHIPSGALALAYDPSQNALYAAGRGVLRCTRPDSAPSWSAAGGELNSIGIGALIYDGTTHTLFAGTSGVLWASALEADLHWHNITTTPNSNEDFNGSGADALAYDSRRDVLYVGTPGIGVRRCANPRGDRVWTTIGDKLTSTNGPNAQSALGLDTARDILYVGGYEAGGELYKPPGGVWRCTKPDTDAVWSNTGGPLHTSQIDMILYDPGRAVLFAAANDFADQNLWKRATGVWRYEPPTSGKKDN